MKSTDTCVRLTLQRAAAARARRARTAHALGASIGCLVLAALLLTPMAISFHGTDGLATQGLFGASLFGDEAGGYVLVGLVSCVTAVAVTLAFVRRRGPTIPLADEPRPAGVSRPPAGNETYLQNANDQEM